MSNVDNYRGFWPLYHFLGGEIQAKEYILTTGATVYRGDVLKSVNTGTVEASAAADGVIVVGVSAEYKADAASAGGIKVLVYDDPYIVFGAQSSSGTATAAANIGELCDHICTHSGSTTTYISGMEASSTLGQAQLKILGKIDSPDNAWGEHVDVAVMFNEHLYKAAVAGV